MLTQHLCHTRSHLVRQRQVVDAGSAVNVPGRQQKKNFTHLLEAASSLVYTYAQ